MQARTNLALISNENREQNIMMLRNWFNRQTVMTVAAAAQKSGYTAATIRRWCRDGQIPLMDPTGPHNPVVPLTMANRPPWIPAEMLKDGDGV